MKDIIKIVLCVVVAMTLIPFIFSLLRAMVGMLLLIAVIYLIYNLFNKK